jgi:hypothetical protein
MANCGPKQEACHFAMKKDRLTCSEDQIFKFDKKTLHKRKKIPATRAKDKVELKQRVGYFIDPSEEEFNSNYSRTGYIRCFL